jgi:hypothetical protein
MDSAAVVMRQVEAAGFLVMQEQHSGLVRVLVTGILATNVQSAVQRLGAMGFTQIWVRD